ncbi:hypothetical protein ACP4OV_026082 [Aristida adscensionis]
MAPLFHIEALLPSSISPKLSSLLQSHVYPRAGRVFRFLARFKSLLLDALNKKRAPARHHGGGGKYAISYHSRSSPSSKTTTRGFTKPPHLLWAGGDSPARAAKEIVDVSHARSCYYESAAWNVVVPAVTPADGNGGGGGEDEYCGYLCWLEEEEKTTPGADEDIGEVDVVDAAAAGGSDDNNGAAMNEIDRLAESFIARCHAKFLLEKQESYRRFQEMIARSV